jgi:cytochrome c-type biogenesis protein CcmH
MRVRAILVALAALVALAPAAIGAEQVTLGELEEEVMCPICGTLLQLAEAPQAQRQKAFISRLIAEGKSEDQIKDALVAEYGREVLALPEGEGFGLSAYLVPIIAFILAAITLAVAVVRWRRAGKGGGGGPGRPAAASAGPKGEDAERLDADLARYEL